MEDKPKIAFFDFCETLANFQTADAFVDFIRQKSHSRRMVLLERLRWYMHRLRILSFLEKWICPNYPLYKTTKLLQLRGLSNAEVERYSMLYYLEKIKPNLIPQVLSILQDKQRMGYSIVLVSGGYGVYLKHFAVDFNIHIVISSNIKFRNNVCTGLLDGIDCMNENKITLLEAKYDRHKIYSEAFSDSKSDLPLLNWVDSGVVISKEKHQEWVTKPFKEIIW